MSRMRLRAVCDLVPDASVSNSRRAAAIATRARRGVAPAQRRVGDRDLEGIAEPGGAQWRAPNRRSRPRSAHGRLSGPVRVARSCARSCAQSWPLRKYTTAIKVLEMSPLSQTLTSSLEVEVNLFRARARGSREARVRRPGHRPGADRRTRTVEGVLPHSLPPISS